jgi:hypothetical protein
MAEPPASGVQEITNSVAKRCTGAIRPSKISAHFLSSVFQKETYPATALQRSVFKELSLVILSFPASCVYLVFLLNFLSLNFIVRSMCTESTIFCLELQTSDLSRQQFLIALILATEILLFSSLFSVSRIITHSGVELRYLKPLPRCD